MSTDRLHCGHTYDQNNSSTAALSSEGNGVKWYTRDMQGSQRLSVRTDAQVAVLSLLTPHPPLAFSLYLVDYVFCGTHWCWDCLRR